MEVSGCESFLHCFCQHSVWQSNVGYLPSWFLCIGPTAQVWKCMQQKVVPIVNAGISCTTKPCELQSFDAFFCVIPLYCFNYMWFQLFPMALITFLCITPSNPSITQAYGSTCDRVVTMKKIQAVILANNLSTGENKVPHVHTILVSQSHHVPLTKDHMYIN